MSGAKQTLQAQASNSHNLANASTTGFREDLAQFRSIPVYGQGYPTRVYAMHERPGVNFEQGSIQTTGRQLDVAVNGEGWIAVQAKDGSEAYTRAGDLRLTPEGILETGAGLPVIGGGGPIAIPPTQKLDIGADGTISIIPLGDKASTLAVLDQIKLVKPPLSQLEKRDDGLVQIKDGGIAEASADVGLITGAIEGSNVNAVASMVNMIELARQFEMQIKMMQTVDENEAASSKLMQL
jgi:flagellar basal-body rod protein FlgF